MATGAVDHDDWYWLVKISCSVECAMGAKAHDVGIQQRVVMMKDELEKIKEQLMNVL